uniref:Uncharacterized protein n=1 Tax=Ostreococcus mediterraneus TaxID=1486918 RepID=A0A7S0Z8C9_9CHLO
MRPPSICPASPLFKINGSPSLTREPSLDFVKNCTAILPSTTTVMSSPGCECGGSADPFAHCSMMTSTPFGVSADTANRAVNPSTCAHAVVSVYDFLLSLHREPIRVFRLRVFAPGVSGTGA